MHLQDVMDNVAETGRKLPIHNVTSISLATERRSLLNVHFYKGFEDCNTWNRSAYNKITLGDPTSISL